MPDKKTEANAVTEREPKTEGNAAPETASKAKTETERGARMGAEPEAKAGQKTEAKTEAKTASNTEPGTDGQPARVDYVLPRNAIGCDDCVTVILNGAAYQIQAGQQVSIPAGVAEILDGAVRETRALEARMKALEQA